jgi:diadenosine tetraphosphate (Ap4A) HIT family hydrolase
MSVIKDRERTEFEVMKHGLISGSRTCRLVWLSGLPHRVPYYSSSTRKRQDSPKSFNQRTHDNRFDGLCLLFLSCHDCRLSISNLEGLTMECPFCPKKNNLKIIDESGSIFAIEDNYPVAKGHVLIIPHRHTPDYFSMTSEEVRDAEQLLRRLRERLLHQDATIAGFNVGMNCGISAGQTILHAHIHLIPRRDGDTPKPRGGVRGVIPDKMFYP